ncbi:MAG: hypothetical protein N2039_06760 [Gemmataceae bacterium]|nr:hypothetical protein [Gemmataceae bacterium]
MNAIPVILYAVLLGLLWVCVLLWLIGRLTGWHRLARTFPVTDSLPQTLWRFQTVYLRFGGKYSGIVTVGADTRGLYLALLPVFNVGHPPCYIPWQEMQLEMKRHWSIGEYLEIRFPRVRNVVLMLPAKLAAKIAAAVGPHLAAVSGQTSVAHDAPPSPGL